MTLGLMTLGLMTLGLMTVRTQACGFALRTRHWLLVAAFFATCALPSTAQAPPQPSPETVRFRLQSRDIIEKKLKSFSTNNLEREALIRKWLVDAGCSGADISEEALDRKLPPRHLPPNVVCILPGETRQTIVVGAHTDHVSTYGDGVVDNWTGAVLLPALFYGLSAQPRHHTFIFVGFSAEEKGLLGSRYYVSHLSPGDRARVAAMINFDSLGLGPTEVWTSHADKSLLDDLARVSLSSKLPLNGREPPPRASADSESFAPYGIPRITLHSITPETWKVLHSPFDKLDAVNMDDYYQSYRLIAEYLAYLDQTTH